MVDSGFSGRGVDGGSGDWWHGGDDDHHGGGGDHDGHHGGDHHDFDDGSHFAFSFGLSFGFPFGFCGYSYYPFCGYYYPYYYWGYPSYYSYCYYPWYWGWGYSYYTPYYRRVIYETEYVTYVESPSTTTYVSSSYLPPAEVVEPQGAAAETPEAVSAKFLSEGDVAFRSGDYPKAAELFKAAVNADPGSSIARFALGEALFATGDYHYAAYSIKKGLELDPAWADADAGKERFYSSMDAFDGCLARLEDHAAKNPYDATAHFLLGYQLYYARRYDAAAAAFEKHAGIVGADAAAKLFTDRIPAKKAAIEAKPAEAAPATPVPAGAGTEKSGEEKK